MVSFIVGRIKNGKIDVVILSEKDQLEGGSGWVLVSLVGELYGALHCMVHYTSWCATLHVSLHGTLHCTVQCTADITFQNNI